MLAETSIDHAVGQLFVSPVNPCGTILENNNNNDIQGGQVIDRDITSGRECDQLVIGQEDRLRSSHWCSTPAAVEGNIHDVLGDYKEAFGDLQKAEKPCKEKERVASNAYSASPGYHESPLATASIGALVQNIEKVVSHAFSRHYLGKAR